VSNKVFGAPVWEHVAGVSPLQRSSSTWCYGYSWIAALIAALILASSGKLPRRHVIDDHGFVSS
jgi:hypothetical protein